MSIVRIHRIYENKTSKPKQTVKPAVSMWITPEFIQSLKKYKTEVGSKVAEFIKQKREDPLSKFGTKDQHFSSGGNLGPTGVIHAHLNHDIQILYRRYGKNPTVIELMLITSHDDIGTGQPPNMKKQKIAAKMLTGMTAKPMVTESRGNVLQDQFQVLRNKKANHLTQEDAEPLTRDENIRLTTLKHIKDRDIWEKSGTRTPAYGPALSHRVSATREIVLHKRSPDSKIVVAQRSDTLAPNEDTLSKSFANTEIGYGKALDYFISLTR